MPNFLSGKELDGDEDNDLGDDVVRGLETNLNIFPFLVI